MEKSHDCVYVSHFCVFALRMMWILLAAECISTEGLMWRKPVLKSGGNVMKALLLDRKWYCRQNYERVIWWIRGSNFSFDPGGYVKAVNKFRILSRVIPSPIQSWEEAGIRHAVVSHSPFESFFALTAWQPVVFWIYFMLRVCCSLVMTQSATVADAPLP